MYQQIAQGLITDVDHKAALKRFGDHLVTLAREAYALRRMDAVEALGTLLVGLPLPPAYQSAGNYYQGLCLKRRGQAQEAGQVFGLLAAKGPPAYRGKALLALASLAYEKGDLSSSRKLYTDASRAAFEQSAQDWLTGMQARRAIAVLRGINGDHRNALADLQSLFPLARAVGAAHPTVFYDYLNSLSVEYGETGQLEEAGRVCGIVLASPYAKAYPAWRETGRELALKAYRAPRSVVAVRNPPAPSQDNVMRLRVRAHDEGQLMIRPLVAQPPARVLNYAEYIRRVKKKPREESPPAEKTAANGKTESELFFDLMELLSYRRFDAEQLSTLLEFAERISSPPEAEPPSRRPVTDNDR